MKHLVAAGALAALTACGTTVSPQAQLGTGFEADAPPATAPVRGEESAHDPVAAATTGAAPAAVPDQVARPSTPRPGTRLKPEILVGVEYSADYEQTMSSFGFDGLASGDIPALVKTIVADVSAKGGLLGSKLRVVFHNTSTSESQSNPSSAAQSVCDDFLLDHRVDFVLTPSAIITDCFVQRRVPVVQYGTITPNGADRGFLGPRAPFLFAPSSFETDTLYPLYIARLAAQGFFPRTGKVGVLWSSHPSEQRQSVQVLRLLRERKAQVAATFEYDATNAASITSSVASSVLRFQTAGVDHVIGLDGNIGLFMIQAEQQQYRPRYAMNTFMGPTSVQAALVPAAQLKGAVGVGWEPVNDVPSQYDDLRTPARSACDAYVKRSGQNLAGKPTAQFAAYSVCDGLSILIKGVRGSSSLDAALMRAALGRLGTRFPGSLNLVSAYGPRQSAGAVAVRDLRYVDSCACFQYGGKQLFR